MFQATERRTLRNNPLARRIELLSYLLDSYITIPGTTFKIGLDPIIGLFPGVGDLITGGASLYLVYLSARIGLPRSVLLRMLGNVLVDVVIGAVPIIGDLFDFTWKANARNLEIVDRYLARDVERTESDTSALRPHLLHHLFHRALDPLAHILGHSLDSCCDIRIVQHLHRVFG